jgi:hypothetical protein
MFRLNLPSLKFLMFQHFRLYQHFRLNLMYQKYPKYQPNLKSLKNQ